MVYRKLVFVAPKVPIHIAVKHKRGLWILNIINQTFDEDRIINNEATSLQLCVGDKSWTATGNVHVRVSLPKRAAHGVWLEGFEDVPTSRLVEELEGDLVCE